MKEEGSKILNSFSVVVKSLNCICYRKRFKEHSEQLSSIIQSFYRAKVTKLILISYRTVTTGTLAAAPRSKQSYVKNIRGKYTNVSNFHCRFGTIIFAYSVTVQAVRSGRFQFMRTHSIRFGTHRYFASKDIHSDWENGKFGQAS